MEQINDLMPLAGLEYPGKFCLDYARMNKKFCKDLAIYRRRPSFMAEISKF